MFRAQRRSSTDGIMCSWIRTKRCLDLPTSMGDPSPLLMGNVSPQQGSSLSLLNTASATSNSLPTHVHSSQSGTIPKTPFLVQPTMLTHFTGAPRGEKATHLFIIPNANAQCYQSVQSSSDSRQHRITCSGTMFLFGVQRNKLTVIKDLFERKFIFKTIFHRNSWRWSGLFFSRPARRVNAGHWRSFWCQG